MLAHWVWLSCAVLPSGRGCNGLLETFGSAEEIYAKSRKDYAEIEGITRGELERLCDKSLSSAEGIIEYCSKNNIGIMSMEDECYPDQLKNIFSPPPVLYWRGKLPDFKNTPMFTVVGTRKSTKEGERAAYEFSVKLSETGCVIVSGMASGIDTNANKGGLAGGAPTIAILGCGVDVVYPAGNRELMNDIISHGVVISEFPPKTKGFPQNFPIRNRIMAALGMGVLVVEAPAASGALITARLAIDMGKDVFVIPGSIFNSAWEGSNNLIKEGCCIPVTTPLDIVEKLPVYFELKEKSPKELERENMLDSVASPVERAIAELLIHHRRLHIDEIKELTGFSQGQVLTSVMMLEIYKIAVNEGADVYAVYE